MLFLLAFSTLGALILLAGTLDGLEFRAAVHTGGARQADPSVAVRLQEIAAAFLEVPLWKQALLLAAGFGLVLLVSLLLSAELRRQLIREFIRMAVFVLAVFYLLRTNPEVLSGILNPFSQAEATDPPAIAAEALPAFEPPRLPDWLAYGAAFLIAILLMGVLFWVQRRLRQARDQRGRGALVEVGRAARAGLKRLESGRDLHHTILDSYARMCRAVEDRRGISRGPAMTSSEFSNRLVEAGLPPAPVRNLTHLFETVRYGGRAGERLEIEEAAACLQSILSACEASR